MTISNRVPLGEQLILDMEENPFAEYMWMENEEEFDRQVEFELWEQDFIESCFNQMLEEEEQWEWFIPSRDLPSLHCAPCPLSEHQHSAPCPLSEHQHSAPCPLSEHQHSAPCPLSEHQHSAPCPLSEHQHSAPCPLSEHQHCLSLTDACSQTELSLSSTDILLQSSLNPNAKEFTPGIQSHVM